MKKIKKSLIKSISLVLVLITLFFAKPIYSQGLQIDMSTGGGPSAIILEYDNPFTLYGGPTSSKNFTYYIGLTNKIKGKFYLRTEMGLLKIETRLRVDYEYELAPNFPKKQVLSFDIFNERMYLGFIPEFRHSVKKFDLFINAGFLIASDIDNNYQFDDFGQDNPKLHIWGQGDELVFGYKIGGGINYNIGSIALKLSLGGLFFNKSILFNSYSPYIRYNNSRIGFGIVYSVGK